MKLYVCWGTFQTPRPGGHPCANAYNALRDAGHDPEVDKVHGLGVGPKLPAPEDRRPQGGRGAERAPTVPVLVTDSGEVISESKRIVDWAEANPATAPTPA